MRNRTKSWTLLFVFSLSLVPFGAGQAEGPDQTFEEARYLLYLGDAFLEQEANLDSAAYFRGLMAPVPGIQGAEGAQEVMNRMIHAAKQERNDLDANCRQLTRRYQSAGDPEAVQKLAAYCESEHQRLTNRIKFLRKLRGDRRKALTRFWHSIKRGSANFWRRIGPLGRTILRKVGDQALNTVASGGSLNVGRLVKQVAKQTMRGKLKNMMYEGVARLVTGQLKIAREAGILEDGEAGENDVESLLESLEEASVAEAQETTDQTQTDNQSQDGGQVPGSENTDPAVTFTGTRSLICDQWVGEGGDSDGMGRIPLDVNFNAGEFYGEASFPFVDSLDYPQTSTYVYEGSVSEEGILIGKMSVTITVNNVDVGYITINTALAGIVTDDGKGIILQTFQESNTERLELFEQGRAAVLGDPYFANSLGGPPSCR